MTNTMQLASGRKVALHSLHLSSTYAGVLEGSPDAVMNAGIIKQAKTHMDRVWGPRRTLVIEPEVEMIDLGDEPRPRMPACRYTAWLVSEPINPTYCGSELVVVSFGPWSIDASLRNLVQEAVKDVAWEANARDFDY